ncbi:MAG: DHHA1 domain-containing protein, partial [Candidatus Saccharicenans sp.]|nr:DHHA1 domain-containing protein [Candidatus Saccharicenans sp.]
ITTIARSIKGVEMVIFFKEVEPGVFRVSLRSKGPANSALVAESFGGGGHQHAAGFTVRGEFEQLYREIPLVVEDLLQKNRTKS